MNIYLIIYIYNIFNIHNFIYNIILSYYYFFFFFFFFFFELNKFIYKVYIYIKINIYILILNIYYLAVFNIPGILQPLIIQLRYYHQYEILVHLLNLNIWLCNRNIHKLFLKFQLFKKNEKLFINFNL